jgi:hypothetical protein
MMQEQAEHYHRQALRYCYDDGFMEIALGAIFTLASVALTAIMALSKPAAIAVGIAAMIVLLGASFAANRIVHDLKERITYMRTGFVRPREQAKSIWIEIGTALAFVLMSLAVVLLVPDNDVASTIFSGMLMALTVGYLANHARLARLYVVAALALASGIAASLSSLPLNLTYMLPYGVAGLGLLITGTFTLQKYLRENPPEA